jgi:hypothetical protein
MSLRNLLESNRLYRDSHRKLVQIKQMDLVHLYALAW